MGSIGGPRGQGFGMLPARNKSLSQKKRQRFPSDRRVSGHAPVEVPGAAIGPGRVPSVRHSFLHLERSPNFQENGALLLQRASKACDCVTYASFGRPPQPALPLAALTT